MRLRDLGPAAVVGGSPTVLLLHGSAVPAAYLEVLAAILARTRRVLLPDLPGYGASGVQADPLVGAQAELELHLRTLNVGSIDVVGVALGAYRAFRLALSGVSVRRLVTLSGFAGLSDDERRRARAFAGIARRGGDLCDLLIQHALAPERRDTDRALVERLRSWIHEVAPPTLAVELEAMAALEDLRPRLGDLRAGLLAIHGTDDALVPAIRSTEIAGSGAGALIELVPCGHLLLEEMPDRVIPTIRRFLG